MLRYQVGLIALLIACVAFISCDIIQEILTPPMPEEDMMPTDDMMAGLPMYISMYTSWVPKVSYPGPTGTGGVHGEGARTVYINDVGAMALEDEDMTAYPTGTIIVKEIMDDANTFVQKVATMMKTDDSRHNGWTYKKYGRPDENADYMQVKGDGLPDAAEGCHACHAAAPMDSVFVDFSMDDATTDDDTMPDDDMTTDDTTTTDDMTDYTSWLSVTYAAISPAHGQGDRTVYINDIGAMALQDASMTAFPVGTVVVKDIMDDTNTAVAKTERMEKTDEYAPENGWLYNEGATQAGCHGCHVGAGAGVPGIDSVFTIQFPMPDMGAEEQ